MTVRPLDLLGFSAALAVLAGSCMNSIRPLRRLARASNVLFALYGLLAHIYPVFVLHMILMPINLVKLHQASALEDGGGRTGRRFG
jgi:hypothetical protein